MTSIEVLTEFVRQSNMIEGEPTEPGHPLFDDHLEVALRIEDDPSWFISFPLQIHKQLMQSQLSKFPGELRQCRVQVGGEEKMLPTRVRQELPLLVSEVVRNKHYSAVENLDLWCWEMHYRFEWIHPFIDGNGRTGRLWMNAVRLSHGLDWATVLYKDRFAYYRAIEEWENNNK